MPKNFSLVNNPEEVLAFFERMRRMFAKKKNIRFDLSKVTDMTADAITVLVSRLKDSRYTRGRNYLGNEPENETLRRKFTESGFYKFVISNTKPKNRDYGSIRARATHKVEGKTALELITFATERLYGEYRKRGGVYKTLAESMNNTRDHAAGNRKGPEKWWAAVHFDETAGKAIFTFVDNGIGIFKSRDLAVLQEALRILRIKKNTDLLRKMLLGEIESSTGIPYRGRGLPSIYDCLKRGDIRNLVIITNDVYANIENNDYRTLKNEFDGTFLYWEIFR